MSTWTKAEQISAFEAYEPPMACVTIVVSVLALAAFYSFRKQRTFPASVLAWLVMFNLEFLTYMVIKWSPTSAAHDYLVTNIGHYPKVCQFSVFIDQFHYYSSSGCNTLIALTLFVTLKMQISMSYEDNPIWYYSYMAFAICWPIIIPVIVAVLSPKVGVVVCEANTNPWGYVEVIPPFVLLVAQVVLVGLALKAVYRIIAAAKGSKGSKRDIRLAYMIARFTITLMSEFMQLLPIYFHELINPASMSVVISQAVLITNPLACLVDALVLLLLNQHLRRFLVNKYRSFKDISKQTSSDSSTGKSKRSDKSSKDDGSKTTITELSVEV